MELTQRKCVPCEGGIPPMSVMDAEKYLKEITNWALIGNKIEKNYKFKNFIDAIEFVNKVAKIAEDEGHHPDILIHGWNKVKLTLFTHIINGLSENDFILAAKIDKILTT